MKKWLIALAVVAALLAGCGSSSGDADDSSASLGGMSSSLPSGGESGSDMLETARGTSALVPAAPDASEPADGAQSSISPDTPVSSDAQETPQQPETPAQTTSSSQGAGSAPAQPQGAQPEQTSQPEEQPEAQPEQPEEPAQQPAQEPAQQPEASQPAETTPPAEESPAPAPSTEPAQQSRTVYITPTGKRYHYDNNCNGGTYIESTLDEALSLGLTPCKKCAGG